MINNLKISLATLIFISSLFLLVFCSNSENEKQLIILEKFNLDIPEPSGLALSTDKKSLWTVSDNNNTVYQIDFQGNIINYFVLDAIDLEGIAVINDTLLAVVSERTGEVIFVTTGGIEVNRINLDYSGDSNSGLEGITYDKMYKRYFVVNEKNPRHLIELDPNLNIQKITEINFFDDLSGLDYDDATNNLWIISDESRAVAKCSTDGLLITKYNVPIQQIEGIAVDSQSKRIYLVSDREEKLYILQMR